MLVLLIIFIITIPAIVAQVHLTLSKATNLPTQTKPENITVSIDRRVRFTGTPSSWGAWRT